MDKLLGSNSTRFLFQVNNQAFALPSKCLILTFTNNRTSDLVDHCFLWLCLVYRSSGSWSLWQIPLFFDARCSIFSRKGYTICIKLVSLPALTPPELLFVCIAPCSCSILVNSKWKSFVLLCYSMLSCSPTWWGQMYLLLLLQKRLAGLWDLKWPIIYQITDVFTD